MQRQRSGQRASHVKILRVCIQSMLKKLFLNVWNEVTFFNQNKLLTWILENRVESMYQSNSLVLILKETTFLIEITLLIVQ